MIAVVHDRGRSLRGCGCRRVRSTRTPAAGRPGAPADRSAPHAALDCPDRREVGVSAPVGARFRDVAEILGRARAPEILVIVSRSGFPPRPGRVPGMSRGSRAGRAEPLCRTHSFGGPCGQVIMPAGIEPATHGSGMIRANGGHHVPPANRAISSRGERLAGTIRAHRTHRCTDAALSALSRQARSFLLPKWQ
jgi:hypothetical protein